MFTFSPLITLAIVVLSLLGVLTRLFRLGEAAWALIGAFALVITLQMHPVQAWHAVMRGHDVYLFLAGMMLMAELARRTGLFDVVAAWAVRLARGSTRRLFCWVYGVGALVTIAMSNDATAVVLTPAVLAAVRAARVTHPLPHLYACAFIANAASFVLPISNPANLVVFGPAMPGLSEWLSVFLLPSIVAILVTFLTLFWHQRSWLGGPLHTPSAPPVLSGTGRFAAAGIMAMAAVLIAASALGVSLGWPSALLGAGWTLLLALRRGRLAAQVVTGVSWSVMGLVAGLFVLVQALDQLGWVAWLTDAVRVLTDYSPEAAVWLSGGVTALVTNGVNNLPAGLLAGTVVGVSDMPVAVRAATLVGIDLGPNLSITGSLATLLWLVALRREGMNVGPWQFFKVGIATLPLTLGATLAVVAWQA